VGRIVLVKISKVCSNDSVPLVYLPKKVVKLLGLEKGVEVKMLVDLENRRFIVEKLEEVGME